MFGDKATFYEGRDMKPKKPFRPSETIEFGKNGLHTIFECSNNISKVKYYSYVPMGLFYMSLYCCGVNFY